MLSHSVCKCHHHRSQHAGRQLTDPPRALTVGGDAQKADPASHPVRAQQRPVYEPCNSNPPSAGVASSTPMLSR